jgi:hypothetical protein
MRFPRCNATDESYCGQCGEPDPSPSVEAFEEFGETVCQDCGIAMLEEAAERDAEPDEA